MYTTSEQKCGSIIALKEHGRIEKLTCIRDELFVEPFPTIIVVVTMNNLDLMHAGARLVHKIES